MRQAAPPEDLAVFGLQARQIAALAEDIEPVSIHCWRAPGSFFSLWHSLGQSRRETGGPQFLAVRLGQGPNEFIVATIAEAVNSPGGNRGRAVAAADGLDLPGERWAVFRPLLEEAAFP